MPITTVNTVSRTPLWISLAVIAAYWAWLLATIGSSSAVPPDFLRLAVSVALKKVAFFLTIWGLLRLAGEGFDTLGVSGTNLAKRIAVGIGIGLLMFAALNVVLTTVLNSLMPRAPQAGPSIMVHFANPRNLLIWLPIGVIGGGIVEELERIFVITRFEKWLGRKGLVAGVLLSSLMFGVGHLYQGPGGAIAVGISGLVFALVYLRRRSAVEAMAAHAFTDVLAMVGATMLAK